MRIFLKKGAKVSFIVKDIGSGEGVTDIDMWFDDENVDMKCIVLNRFTVIGNNDWAITVDNEYILKI